MTAADFGTTVCGGGPAGLAPMVHLSWRGGLAQLLATGLRVVERGDQCGAGSLPHYRISGNSQGWTYVECLDGGVENEYLWPLRDTADARAVSADPTGYPPLGLVGRWLTRLGGAVVDRIQADRRTQVDTRTEAVAVRLQPDGGADVTTTEQTAHGTVTETARTTNVVLAMGGVAPATMLTAPLLPGMTLEPVAHKVVHAIDVLDDRRWAAWLLPRLATAQRVVIVGGSHSAWSTAWLLLHEHRLREVAPDLRIELLHRRPIRLLYASLEEAAADGYRFDPVQDVCPVSQRVNRFCGLRGDSGDLARRVLGLAPSHDEPITTRELADTAESRAGLGRLLAEADLVVCATGFDARLPRLLDVDGSPLRLHRGPLGLTLGAQANLCRADGSQIPELFLYGLGIGRSPVPRLGGEPNCVRSPHGVHLYQHDLGKLLTPALLGARPALTSS
ncbi:MAG: hypothetical protein ACRDRH_15475 [Pseudonocardia sp.]